MTDVKTNLGKPNAIIEEGPAQGRSLLTYVLIAVACVLLIYIVYNKWLIHQPFWGGKGIVDDESDSEDEDEENPKEKMKARKNQREDDVGFRLHFVHCESLDIENIKIIVKELLINIELNLSY